jgi:hypothetical protein
VLKKDGLGKAPLVFGNEGRLLRPAVESRVLSVRAVAEIRQLSKTLPLPVSAGFPVSVYLTPVYTPPGTRPRLREAEQEVAAAKTRKKRKVKK